MSISKFKIALRYYFHLNVVVN